MSEKYILDGHKTVACDDLIKWAEWYEAGNDNRRVASSSKDGVRVSTVFLALNHAWGENEPPLLFETMIFGGEHDQFQDRCSTWEQSEAMHKKACELAGIEP